MVLYVCAARLWRQVSWTSRPWCSQPAESSALRTRSCSRLTTTALMMRRWTWTSSCTCSSTSVRALMKVRVRIGWRIVSRWDMKTCSPKSNYPNCRFVGLREAKAALCGYVINRVLSSNARWVWVWLQHNKTNEDTTPTTWRSLRNALLWFISVLLLFSSWILQVRKCLQYPGVLLGTMP